MSDDPIDSTSGDRFTSRLQGAVRTRWGAVRAFWDGLKLAKASALSVLIGLLMFYGVPQVQDLFLEVRGSALMGTLFWALFYLAILVAGLPGIRVLAMGARQISAQSSSARGSRSVFRRGLGETRDSAAARRAVLRGRAVGAADVAQQCTDRHSAKRERRDDPDRRRLF